MLWAELEDFIAGTLSYLLPLPQGQWPWARETIGSMLHRHGFRIMILLLAACLVSALASSREENTLTPQ
jgi:hypothetical protein